MDSRSLTGKDISPWKVALVVGVATVFVGATLSAWKLGLFKKKKQENNVELEEGDTEVTIDDSEEADTEVTIVAVEPVPVTFSPSFAKKDCGTESSKTRISIKKNRRRDYTSNVKKK
eukprot:TRINITY_DN591_c0_g1_i2.p1 TRINITY_DN591_c0_g1~~TRINITY_DN591_c0_g1_i2.p1  ORF type:complete len:117 (-),score=16.42 TRINITY_DN591_c0_g1_i2:19-369(-)